MNKTSTHQPSLRASCERCRGQKLRCIPCSKDGNDGPCQRCVRANVAESCFFASRLRTGQAARSAKPSSDQGSRPKLPRREKGASSRSLPGMSTFVLSASSGSSSGHTDRNNRGSISSDQTPPTSSTDHTIEMVEDVSELGMLDIWQQEQALLESYSQDFFLRPSSDMQFEVGHSEFAEVDIMDQSLEDLTNGFGLSDFINQGTNNVGAQRLSHVLSSKIMNSDFDADTLVEDKPGLVADLSTLLAEMESYKHQLVSLSSDQHHDYPIGDAIFLSHRLRIILSGCDSFLSANRNSSMSPPTTLLALSCLMTLTRIYSLVFRHLQDQLDRATEAYPAQQATGDVYHTDIASMQSFRGMRLSQLQPLCFCTKWEATKKIVSILLRTLGGVERLLSLPSDARVILGTNLELEEMLPPSTRPAGQLKLTIFEQGHTVSPTNDYLRSVLSSQAKELREKIQTLMQDGLLAKSSCNHEFKL